MRSLTIGPYKKKNVDSVYSLLVEMKQCPELFDSVSASDI
jgi:hypothetical protein